MPPPPAAGAVVSAGGGDPLAAVAAAAPETRCQARPSEERHLRGSDGSMCVCRDEYRVELMGPRKQAGPPPLLKNISHDSVFFGKE